MAAVRVKLRIAGTEVRRIRRRMKLTQTEFAKLIGVSHITVARWEAGARLCQNKFAAKVRALAPEVEPKLPQQQKAARIRWEKQRIGGGKVLVQLPDEMRDAVDEICKVEMRTISDMVRESLRRYITEFKRTAPAKVRLDMIYETMEIEEPAVKD